VETPKKYPAFRRGCFMHIKTSPPFARSQATYTFRQVSWLPAHRSCAFPKVNSVALLQVAPRLQWRHRAGFALLALHRTSLFSQYGHLNAVHNQTAYSIVRNPGSILAQHREKFHPLSQKSEAKGTGVSASQDSLLPKAYCLTAIWSTEIA